jgi:AcrR family transcriptional regulator
MRMAPSEREEQIVQAAIRFFADNGFSGTARDLAARIGVVHGLLYRYFPTKEALLERVYQEVFEGRWNSDWLHVLSDRSQPLRTRLVRVYGEYAQVILTYEWLRIFLLSGLGGLSITDRYRAFITEHLYPVVISELRFALGLRGGSERSLSETEEDLMYCLHGSILFMGIRKWVHRLPVREDVTPNIERLVDIFLAGAEKLLGYGGKPKK